MARSKSLVLGLLLFSFLPAFSQDAEISALKQLAQAGDVTAAMKLANAYENGKGITADKSEAASWYMKAAQAGNETAEYMIAVKYRRGEGLAKDPAKAVAWFRKAAKQGNAQAMYNLGSAYHTGEGTPVNDATSLAWFIAAQTFGDNAANDAVQRALTDLKGTKLTDGLVAAAAMLITGGETPPRPAAAVPWLAKAIDAGRRDATVMMAGLYLQGNGVPRDFGKAVQYCTMGAKERYPEAYACLGYVYTTGAGEAVNLSTAANWYEKAARCGQAKSIYTLSTLYRDGKGVKQDTVQEYAMLLLASKAIPEAREDAASLKTRLSDKQIKQGEKKAAEFASKFDRSCGVIELKK